MSTGLCIIALISYILWWEGLIDTKIMVAISWVASSAGFITFLFLMNHSTVSRTNVIIPKGHYDEKIIKAETDIFPSFLVPTNTYKNCRFRISLQIKEFKKYPLFYLIRKHGLNTIAQELNKDIKLDPGSIHMFDVAIHRNEELNFKFSEDVTIQKLLVEEIYIA